MRTDELKQIVSNPDYIPGIYSYCDRWCERCAFTKRCANFAIGESFEVEGETMDLENGRFWDTIHESFRLTFELIQKTAEGLGIDSSETEPADVDSEGRSHDRARQSPIGISSMAYFRLVDAWFEDAGERFQEKGKELEPIASADLAGMDVDGELSDLKDCVEVIRWYQTQIHVKMLRAVQGAEEETEAGLPKDSDGSAKVALVGIDRSIGAWSRMWRCHFPEEEDVFLPVLAHLQRIRRQIESEFPDARSFDRPGLDD